MANLRVKKKHLNPDAVDGTKLKLLKNEAVRVVDENDDVVDLVKLDIAGNVIGNGYELAKKVELDAETTSRQNAVLTEQSARIAGDLNEQSSRVAAIDLEISSRQAAINIEITSRQNAILTEESARIAEDSTLRAALEAEVTSRQNAISDLIDSAPELLNTLKELADALGGDEDFATTIANKFSDIETSIGNAEEHTDQKYQDVLTLISETLLKKEIVTITAQNVTDGYVDLTATDVIPKSMTASIDRLSVFEDEDFSLSVVEGVTRMTFLNSFATGGDEAIEENEQLRLTYWSLT